MEIVVASDHGGYNLKELIKDHLLQSGFQVEDIGTHSTETVDYPDMALKAAQAVAAGDFKKGIIICGTGIGVSITANKVAGIRAALCHDTFSAAAAREHNDANILTMGERVIGPGLALKIVDTFLTTSFAEGRHTGRVDKVKDIEKRLLKEYTKNDKSSQESC